MSDLKELKLNLEYLLGIPDGVFGDREVIYGDLAEAALAAISTLEAKLAVAREALGEIAEREGYTAETPNDYNRGWNAGRFRARQTAEQALKEIEQ